MAFNGFVLAGTHSGAGKTTITAGILSALKARGLCVQPYKTGPDYIDPSFHSFVVGRKSRNLDTWLLDENAVRYLFAKNCQDADVAVVEGVMGLFDGYSGKEDIGSTASLAKTLDLPVILIVDGSGVSRSIAATVLGYSQFDKACKIAGVILNRLSGPQHYEILKEAIEFSTNIPCLGYVLKDKQIQLSSRHLGLIPACEIEDLADKLSQVGKMVEETIDIDLLLELSQTTKPTPCHHCVEASFDKYKGLRVGIALDSSFNFYYWDNIDLMTELGCECVFFSPMKDETLPENLDFVYIGGGFPEVFGKELTSNTSFIASLRAYQASGKPIYAECGGLMYLTEAIVDLEGKRHEMTGILSGETIMTKQLKQFGYNEVETSSQLTEEPLCFKSHEFHRSEYVNHGLSPNYHLYKNKGLKNQKEWDCGYRQKMAFGAYAHVHFYSEPKWLYYWLNQAKKIKETGYESI